MVTTPPPEELFETLRLAQRLGFLGAGPIDRVLEQGRLFVEALGPLSDGDRVIDLGSGGGSPGLITAYLRPDLRFVLLDRRQKRTDFLLRAVRRMELDNAEVMCDDVSRVIETVTNGVTPPFQGLTARGFGPPTVLVNSIVHLLARDGIAAVSDPPDSDRWTTGSLSDVGLHLEDRRQVVGHLDGGVAVLRRV